jgi:hypothetical protein
LELKAHLLFESVLGNGMRNVSTDGQPVHVAAVVHLQHLSNSSKPIMHFDIAFMIQYIVSEFGTTCRYDTTLLDAGLDFLFIVGL